MDQQGLKSRGVVQNPPVFDSCLKNWGQDFSLSYHTAASSPSWNFRNIQPRAMPIQIITA
jgi:hypothetical protein